MNKRPPAWLIPNLLSLDAPIVALVWMWMLADALRVQYVESSSYLLLGAAVWCVYVVDRIRDVSRGVHPIEGEMPWRHRFHWKNRLVLILFVVGIVSYSSFFALFYMSRVLLTVGVVGGVLVACYWFVSLFDKADVAYGKNMVAGLTFAYGVTAPIVVASEPLPIVLSEVFQGVDGAPFVGNLLSSIPRFFAMVFLTVNTVLLSVLVLLFGLLCVMNINAIDLWERSRRSRDPEVKQESEIALSMGLFILVVGAVFAVAFIVDDHSAPLCYAVMASAGLLHVINRSRARFSIAALRVLADLALVVPVPLAVWLT
ncbi:MAG: hypothetical protein ABGY95_11535 [Rubritalea sp.]|uniref:hypothetical protein n=1 Tax=Rubritalea sp. TaxID=2109375 RepID=UPI0032423286